MLPPGTYVYVPPYVLHRDARNFVFPDAFWPERWLVAAGHLALSRARPPAPSTGSDVQVDFVHNDGAFIPFSYGPMNCVGKGLALLEMRMAVCAIVRTFALSIAPGSGWTLDGYRREFRDYFVTTRGKVPVELQVRG